MAPLRKTSKKSMAAMVTGIAPLPLWVVRSGNWLAFCKGQVVCCMSYFECAMIDHKCRAYSVTCVGTMDHGCDFSSKNVYMSSRANYIFNAMHKLGVPYRLWRFQYSRRYHKWGVGIGSTPIGYKAFMQPQKGQGAATLNQYYNNFGYSYVYILWI